MKSIVAYLFISCWSCCLFAQQDAQATWFMKNQVATNPAYAGLSGGINAVAQYRAQWVGLPGHPVEQWLGADMPIYRINGGGGILLHGSTEGAIASFGVKGVLAIHRTINNIEFSGGASLGFEQKSIDGTQLRAPEGFYTDEILIHNDALLPKTEVSAGAADIALGVRAKYQKVEVGVSMAHVLPNAFNFDGNLQPIQLKRAANVYIQGTYYYDINTDFTIRPNVLFKTDMVKYQLDLNSMIEYQKKYWAGLTWRGFTRNTTDAIAVLLGVELENHLSINYAYEANISRLSAVNSGSHEILLRYWLPMKSPSRGRIINNPRFLSK